MGRNRLYFFWDYDLGAEDVRQILAGEDRADRAWVISRLLNAAHWDDIWRYIALDDVRAHWELLQFRTPDLREAWAHALEVWAQTDRQPGVREPRLAYQTEPEPQLRSAILTPLQEAFLTRFFTYDVGEQFFLTGGTALAAFYLGHRLSDDLDFFTVNDQAFDGLQAELGRLGRELDCGVATVVSTPAFRQVVLSTQRDDRLKVDFVRDIETQFGARRRVGQVIVDSLLNIAVNKVTAVFGRGSIKDFVDLYLLLLQGYDLDELFQLAREKDQGFTPFFFAAMLRQVHHVSRLPVMRQPLDLAALVAFYDGLADRLLAKHRPPG